jgi:hypothetical protein
VQSASRAPELHLFILWEHAYARRAEILRDLASRFRIADVSELSWSRDKFSENLTRFYGTNLPDNSFKEVHCGTGPFTVVLVVDEAPQLGARNTSKGRADVNTAVFDAKARYRSWTGGGHRIHATNTPAEAAHDLMLLLGAIPTHFSGARWDGQTRSLQRDLQGARGWTSLSELFETLGAASVYLVLRNFERLPEELPDPEHPDVDFLVKDRRDFAFVANARKVHREPARAMFEVMVGGRAVRCDLRSVGDGYYDERWQAGMLRRRVQQRGLFVPAPEDHFGSLLYHALVHKPAFAEDARGALAGVAAAGACSVSAADLADRTQAMAWLCAFLSRKRYDFTMPDDHSVGFHLEGVPRVRSNVRGNLERHARSFARVLRHELSRKLERS